MVAARPAPAAAAAALALALAGRAAAGPLDQPPQGPPPTRVREALLCEAKQRFANIYADKGGLDWPKKRDNVTLQITKKTYPCGGNNIPMTFGVFEVDDVEPLDVFNVLADSAHQKSWDSLLAGEKELGAVDQEKARGVEQSFDAHPFQDREIFEWQCFNASHDYTDLWVAFSSEQNQALHAREPREDDVTAAQNCLGAYHVEARPGGGAHVTFTTHVNAHPFLVTQGFVFNLMWGKTVDYINAMREQARALAKRRREAGEDAEPIVPDAELFDEDATVSAACAGAATGLAGLVQESELVHLREPGQRAAPSVAQRLFPGVVVVAGAAAVAAGILRHRRRAAEEGVEEGSLLAA